MKKALLFFVVLFFGLQLASAQNLSVSGKVTYADDGTPIIGATIMVKGVNSSATITDVNGAYKLSVPASAPEKVIVASFIGMETQEQPVSVNGQVVNFAMEADAQRIESVVVTGQGLTRSQRSVGFSTAVVNSDELTAAQSPSLMQGVQGKVAGINISQSGGAGTSQKVIVRGYSSITGSNQPLYIIDGMPVDNSFMGNKTLNNSVDFGNQANDINPNDVESMTILKGASATALYGSRAANGVILITTKKARGSKFSVSYDGTFMGQDVLRTPQIQNRFGQGWGSWAPAENGSWGPALDGREHVWGPFSDGSAPDGFEVLSKPYSFVKDNIRGFYKTGFEMTNNIAINMAGENMGLTISYGNVSSDGILQSGADVFERNNVSVRGYIKHKRFSADASINYVRKDVNQAPSGQGGINNALLQYAVDIDYQSVKDYNNIHNNFGNYYTWYAENPWQQIANNKNLYQGDRAYGKLELGYELTGNIKAIARMTGDFDNYRQKRWTEKNTIAPDQWGYSHKADQAGYYYQSTDYTNQLDATVLVTADYKVADDNVGLGGFLGWNMNQRSSGYLQSEVNGLAVPGWYDVTNGNSPAITKSNESRRRLVGVMGQFDFSYKNGLFASLSARNDWSSTLPKANNSFFYWGANLSFVMSEFVDMGDKVDMFKIRAAYGQTGNDADPYYTSTSYNPAWFTIPFGEVNLPFGGASGLIQSNTLGNNILRPEITSEWELGFTLNTLGNRLRIDAGYYDKVTKDQIIYATMPSETGYTRRAMNVGQISNRGIEIALGGTAVRTRDWEWDINVTFSKNWSNVDKLWGEGENEVKEFNLSPITGAWFGLVVGQPVGTIQLPSYEKVEDENDPNYGKYIVDGAGYLQENSGKRDVLGNSLPEFMIGLNTSLRWKNLSIMATFDYRNGGLMYSQTNQTLYFAGNAVETSYNNRQPFIIPNSVREDGRGGYVENDIFVASDYVNPAYQAQYGLTPAAGFNGYYNNSNNPAISRDQYIEKDYIKLRELVLTYSFPTKLFGPKSIKGLSLSLIGRNLFMWTPGDNKIIDPEVTNFGNDLTSEFGEFYASPSLRTFGGSVKITF